MSLGRFEQKMVASAKITSMERFGQTTVEDLRQIKKNLGEEVQIKDLGDGTIKVECADREIKAKVKNYDRLQQEKKRKKKKKKQKKASENKKEKKDQPKKEQQDKEQNLRSKPGKGKNKKPVGGNGKEIDPDEERKDEWVSVWNVENH